ncbi:MAG: Na+/H+ antiporter subunit E [Oligoflexus sp.]
MLIDKMLILLKFIGFYIVDIAYTSFRITLDVLTPLPRRHTGIVAVPLDASSDFEITLIANLITFSPGTLVIDVSPDMKTMFIHALFIDDVDQFIKHVKENYERRVLELLR